MQLKNEEIAELLNLGADCLASAKGSTPTIEKLRAAATEWPFALDDEREAHIAEAARLVDEAGAIATKHTLAALRDVERSAKATLDEADRGRRRAIEVRESVERRDWLFAACHYAAAIPFDSISNPDEVVAAAGYFADRMLVAVRERFEGETPENPEHAAFPEEED